MKKLLRFFTLSVKRRLVNPGLLLILILFPVFSVVLDDIAIDSGRNTFRVLLWCEDPDPLTERAMEALEEGDTSVQFERVDSLEEARAEVAAGTVECAYLFPDELSEHMQGWEDENGYITILCSPSSTMYLVTREIVFAAILHEYTYPLAEAFFHENVIYEDVNGDILERMPDAMKNYIGEDAVTVHLSLSTVRNSAISTEDGESMVYRIPVRALGGVVLFLMALFAAAQVTEERRSGVHLAVPLPTRRFAPPASILTVLIPAGISVVAADFLCGGRGSDLLRLIATLIVYLLMLTAVSWLLSCLFRKSAVLYFLMPVLTLAALILCPIFFNLGQFLLPVRWLQYFLPPTWYLTVYSGGFLTALLSLAVSAVPAAAAWLLERRGV